MFVDEVAEVVTILIIPEGGKKLTLVLHIKNKIFETDKCVQNAGEDCNEVKLSLEKT